MTNVLNVFNITANINRYKPLRRVDVRFSKEFHTAGQGGQSPYALLW
jgi:hypothetical protein